MLEDLPQDAELVEETLRRSGLQFRLKRVDTKADFLEALATFKPTVILSDHGMPEFDGFAALTVARELAPQVPFIFLMGSRCEELAFQSLKRGPTSFVSKNDLQSLPAAIQRADRALGVGPGAKDEVRRNLDLERRVRLRTAELETANRELEAFSYSVSHDLRAPLRHIEGFVEILLTTKADLLDAEAAHYLNTISAAAKQMGHLIDDLLSFSRTARAELKKTAVPLTELVQSCIHDVSPEAQERKVTWQIHPLPIVDADASLLRQVFLNLLSNALKYTRPRPIASIEVGAVPQPEEVVVYVRDNGVGFDMRYVDKLFGVFQRLHRPAEFEGTGIGLANVRRIISRHGGQTWAEGAPGKGAVFYFSLPQDPDAPLAADAGVSHGQSATRGPPA